MLKVFELMQIHQAAACDTTSDGVVYMDVGKGRELGAEALGWQWPKNH